MLERFATGTEAARVTTIKRVAELLEYELALVEAINHLMPVTQLAAYSRPGERVCTSALASYDWTLPGDPFVTRGKTPAMCVAVYGKLYNPATVTTGQSLYALLSVCFGAFKRPGSLRMLNAYLADSYKRHRGTRPQNDKKRSKSNCSSCSSSGGGSPKRRCSTTQAPCSKVAVAINDDDDELITGVVRARS